MTSNDTNTLLAYGFLKGVGKKYLNELATSAKQTLTPVKINFESGKFGNGVFAAEQLDDAFKKASEQIEIAQSLGHSIISMLDDEYPDSLRATNDAPPILFCSGNLELLKKATITIIGTRSPTQHGEMIAERITAWFTEHDWVVASGLAKGIDTIAHQACLKSNGETISVLAHGLEKVYPAQNKQLAKDIVSYGGLLITEYGYNSYVGKSNFVERDRIQAALAKAVVLVQSDITGGSLHASRAVLEYGRHLIVVGQSKRDIHFREEKIGANMVLESDDIKEKLRLLKISATHLDKVILLSNGSLLGEVNNKIQQLNFSSAPNTTGDNIKLF